MKREKESLNITRHEAFHNILGLIMASLSSEAYIETTGLWIAMGYRLWLDHCPFDLETSTLDWRGLFSGLQVSHILNPDDRLTMLMVPGH